ncbi:MAG: DUF4124 domain-containing protein [Burkholderiales bacterium]
MSSPAWAGTYKWVDEDGVTHYGDTLPPEYAERGNTQLNKQGVVIKKTDAAMTPEQRKAHEAGLEAAQEEAKKAEERKRRDAALLSTYTSVEDIELAKKRNLEQVDIRMASTKQSVDIANLTAVGLRKQAASFEQQKKEVPPDISSRLKTAESELQGLQTLYKQRQQEKQAVKLKYAVDRKRFIELTGAPAQQR